MKIRFLGQSFLRDASTIQVEPLFLQINDCYCKRYFPIHVCVSVAFGIMSRLWYSINYFEVPCRCFGDLLMSRLAEDFSDSKAMSQCSLSP